MSDIKIFQGRLGNEHYIGSVPVEQFISTPQHGSLIALVPEKSENDESMVYTVLYPMFDYAEDEICLFVKPYDWED